MKNRGKTRRTIATTDKKLRKRFTRIEKYAERNGVDIAEAEQHFKKLRKHHKKTKARALQSKANAKARKEGRAIWLNSQQRREQRRKAERAVLRAIYGCLREPTPLPVIEVPQAEEQMLEAA